MPAAPPTTTLRFGPYEVDLATGRLHRDGTRIRLPEKSVQVLAALLERPGQTITRDELHRRLWPDGVFVDFDNNLNGAIARLRRALNDRADRPRFIETLPRHGYRFVGSVFEPPPAGDETHETRARLLVLPFVDFTSAASEDHLADALTEELITELARLAPDALAVIARTTAMHYKGTHKDVGRIGREVRVDYVLEGGLRRSGTGAVVNLQLVRTSDQAHVWAHRFEAGMSDVLEAPDVLARAVAAGLGITERNDLDAGTPGRRRSGTPTRDLVAYNEYLLGRRELATFRPEAFDAARQHLERAIARDPGFALAHDAMAEVYWWLGYFGFMRPVDAFATGALHAMRALAIDNTLAETHALLAQYHKQIHYDWTEVERGMARALALDPTSPVVRTRYAFNALMPQGRLAEAVRELERALDVDPLSTATRTALAITLVLSRHFERAIDEARRLLEVDPGAYWGHLAIGASRLYQGRVAEAIEAERKAVEVSGDAAPLLAWLGLSLGISGQVGEARALLARLDEMARSKYVPPTSFAWIHLGLGDTDAAFIWMDRAVDERDQFLMPIKSYGFLDPLRTDPRFAALLRKMNLT